MSEIHKRLVYKCCKKETKILEIFGVPSGIRTGGHSEGVACHTVLGAVWIKDTLKKKIKTLENFFRNWDYILSGS